MSLKTQIMAAADPSLVEGLSRFFKTGPGQYGEGDLFLGIKVPTTRAIVRDCWRETDFSELEECLTSAYHELRLSALLTLVEIFHSASSKKHLDEALRRRCVDFYLAHTDYINNWDLVDLSCYPIIGEWLLHTNDRSLLYDLARNGKSIWERRIGIVSTMTFIRHGQIDDTYNIAEIFLEDGKGLHDLLQKAVGWLLRETGKRDPERLEAWVRARSSAMPRTMLRYAIEKFPESTRKEILSLQQIQ